MLSGGTPCFQELELACFALQASSVHGLEWTRIFLPFR